GSEQEYSAFVAQFDPLPRRRDAHRSSGGEHYHADRGEGIEGSGTSPGPDRIERYTDRTYAHLTMLKKSRIVFLLLAAASVRAETLIPPPSQSIESMAHLGAWKRSLMPFAASQALDVASSWGMRERNPLLAGGDGRFGAKAAGVKIGAAAAIVGVE